MHSQAIGRTLNNVGTTLRTGGALTVAAVIALIGCSEDVPITTEAGIAYGEYSDRMSIGEGRRDFLIVGRPEVLAANADVLIESIEAGLGPHWLNWIRIAVFTPDDAATFIDAVAACEPRDGSCVPDQPQYFDYHWLPYGFATDVDAWRASAACELSGSVECALDVGDGPGFGSWPTLQVVWVVGDAACALDEPCPEPVLDRMRELLATGKLSGNQYVVGEQPDRATLNDVLGQYQHHQHGAPGIPIGKVVVDADGLPACEMRETLPDHGPIERCDQLAEFGRTFDTVDVDGRDVCLIDPQPEPPMGTGGPPGFFFTAQHPDFPEHKAIVLDLEPIPDSDYAWRCQIDYVSAE